jgi:two-component system sensor histidine kinase HydH
MTTSELIVKELPAQLLRDAFDRFQDASAKLEMRHHALQQEVEDLRAQLRKKEEEIIRAERLATLGETAAALAHEVRNPLGAIRLFVSLLRADVEEIPSAVKLVDQIETSVTSLNHVVTNVLEFASTKVHPLHPVNVENILKEQILQLQALHRGKARMSFTSAGSPFILGDECGLRQVMYNLLLNALQATGYAGAVDVALSGKAEEAELTIRDNGPGVPTELMEKIFEPFVTGKREGTGLGLAIVKRILDQHHARIEIRNEGGAVFNIRFPKRSGKI